MASITDLEVRRAGPEDVALLATLNEHVHAPHVNAEPDVYRTSDEAELREVYASRLVDPDVVIFIASAEQPLGFALTVHMRAPRNAFSPARERLLLDTIAVDPAARRRGVGRALMHATERHARELGLRSVQLDVRAFNSEAIRFYEALGYLPVQHRYERKL
ncbi:MAG: GNAT family N-acetyltransferase [Polyangiales bacterium]